MAQKVQITLIDDLDGSEAIETVAFALDGQSFEIDLSARNATKRRAGLAAYVGAARQGAKTAAAGTARKRPSRDRARTADVRAWAKEHGHQIKDRGRVPADVVAEYERAGGK